MKPIQILTTSLVLSLSISIVPQVAAFQSGPDLTPSKGFTAPKAPELQNSNSGQSRSPTPTPAPTSTPAAAQTVATSSSSSPGVTEPATGSWWPWIIIAALVLVVVFLVGRRTRK